MEGADKMRSNFAFVGLIVLSILCATAADTGHTYLDGVAGAGRKLQQASSVSNGSNSQVLLTPITVPASPNSLDLKQRAARSKAGGDLLDLVAVLAELTCADAYQFFQKVENGLDNYGRRVYGTYASPELASCSFTPGGCLGIAGADIVNWNPPAGANMSDAWVMLELLDSHGASGLQITLPSDPALSVIPGLTGASASIKFRNPLIKVTQAGGSLWTDPTCYMYVEYTPMAVDIARAVLQRITGNATLARPGPGRRLQQASAGSTIQCVGESVGAAAGAVAAGAACAATFGLACGAGAAGVIGVGAAAGATCGDVAAQNAAAGQCFPAHATVQLYNGTLKRMDQLEVGDKILSVDPRTGAARFEDVYLFGHRDGQVSAEYIRLGMNCQAEAGDMFQKSLELTPGHFLPVSDDSAAWEDRYMISAERARVGMTLWTAAKPGGGVLACRVAHVSRGIFNPFTLNGLIVVDDVVASAHSDWFLEPFVPAKYEHLIPGLYQQIMGPVRCLYWLVGPAKSRSMAEEWGLVELISGRDAGPFVKWVYGKVAAGRAMLVVAAAAVAARFVKK